MTTYEEQAQAWSAPPVDGKGYYPSCDLLDLEDDALRAMIETMEVVRYDGWRNQNDNWRRVFGLDATRDMDVLDYGCGTGIEALQYAKLGNRVSLADIAFDNVILSGRVVQLFGYQPVGWHQLTEHRPRCGIRPDSLDVVHSAGVLHHIPYVVDVVEEIATWLRAGGELRVMLYSDKTWHEQVGGTPPDDVGAHPDGPRFVEAMDAVGAYADWYDAAKIERMFGHVLDVQNVEYLDTTLHYLGAVLVKR